VVSGIGSDLGPSPSRRFVTSIRQRLCRALPNADYSDFHRQFVVDEVRPTCSACHLKIAGERNIDRAQQLLGDRLKTTCIFVILF
jgi:hypothetical protein